MLMGILLSLGCTPYAAPMGGVYELGAVCYYDMDCGGGLTERCYKAKGEMSGTCVKK